MYPESLRAISYLNYISKFAGYTVTERAILLNAILRNANSFQVGMSTVYTQYVQFKWFGVRISRPDLGCLGINEEPGYRLLTVCIDHIDRGHMPRVKSSEFPSGSSKITDSGLEILLGCESEPFPVRDDPSGFVTF